ncbi:Serine/threonine-protein kinase HT1, partial [Leucoagaricus sp. SymC.cos]
WPSKAYIRKLAESSSPLFSVAMSALQFIGNGKLHDPIVGLEAYLDFVCMASDSTTSVAAPLSSFQATDSLYSKMLNAVPDEHFPTLMSILCLRASYTGRDLSACVEANILNIDQSSFYAALDGMHSILRVPPPDLANKQGMTFYHPSFLDFLKDPNRSGKFAPEFKKSYSDVAQATLQWYDVLLSSGINSGYNKLASRLKWRPDTDARLLLGGIRNVVSEDSHEGVLRPKSASLKSRLLFWRAMRSSPASFPLRVERCKIVEHVSISEGKISSKPKHSADFRIGSRTNGCYTGAEAQQILDILDAVLSSPLNVVSDAARPRIVKTLSRLSTSSRRYPRQLILQGIETENSELGSGAYGVVSKGTYKGNQICVKMGRSQGNDKRNDAMVKVFLREAVLWSHLLHPNVLPLYGIFQPNNQGAIGLVSPWMPNGNMLEYLEKNPNTPRMPLIHDVLAGLIYLHQHHVVHGDLKGVNILIDDGGTACLADFGLSTLIDPIGTVSTLPGGKGTYRWMAPEAFTGQIPFHDLTQATLLRRLSNPSQYKPDRPNKTAAPELTDGIWHIMQDCWSKDPSRRPEVGTVIQRLAGLGFSPSPRALTASRRYGELPLVRFGSGVHGFNLLAARYPKIMIS